MVALLLLALALPQEQPDPELEKAAALLKRDRGQGIRTLENIVLRRPGTDAASQALLMLARHHFEHREGTQAVAVLRRHAEMFGAAGITPQAEELIEHVLVRGFTDHPTFPRHESFIAEVKPSGTAFARYRLFGVDPDYARTRLREAKDDLRDAPTERLRLLKEGVLHFDPAHPAPQRFEGGPALPGLYVFEEEIDGFRKRWLHRVLGCGLLVKHGPSEVFAHVYRTESGEPVPGVDLELHSDGVRTAKTDAQGCARFPVSRSGWIVALPGNETLSCPFNTEREDAEDSLYITTDRPVYRAGQAVHFRAILRDGVGRRLRLKPRGPVAVEILDPDERRVWQGSLVPSEFGTVHGSFQLGDEPPLGAYSVVVRDAHTREEEFRWSLGSHGCTFHVLAYRKPEMRVEVRGSAAPGAEGRATITATYLFGSPAADTEVQWSVSARRLYPWNDRQGLPPIGNDHPYAWYRERDRVGGGDFGDETAQGEGRTGPDGSLEIRFPAKIEDDDAVYTVYATVTDASRQAADGRADIATSKGDHRLLIHLDRNFYRAGQKASIRVAATDSQGRPAAGRKIELAAFIKEDEEYEQTHAATAVADATGTARFEFDLERAGHARFRARSGGAVTRRHGWVAGDDLPGRPKPDESPELEVIPERYVYLPGEKVALFLRATHRGIRGLMTVETDRVIDSRVLRLDKLGTVLEIPVPADAAPAITIKVHASKGREVVGGGARLLIVPRDKWLEVTVKADRAAYRPGDKARATVEVRDGHGRPVAAEVALGVVDEAIHLLQPEDREDIRRRFYPPAGDEVVTASDGGHYDDYFDPFAWTSASIGTSVLTGAAFTLEEPRMAIAAVSAPTQTRRRFPDTLHWAPAVRTGADGKAEIDLEIADSLTTWIFTAHAVGPDHAFGWGRSTTLVRKDAMVRLIAPRFLTQGDETTVSAIVHNELETKETFAVSVSARGAEVEGARDVRETVEARSQKRVEWRVRVKDPGAATFEVKALGTKASDAMEIEIPVKPHGMPRAWHRAGKAEAAVEEAVAVPEGALAAELTIVASPGPLTAVMDALPYLIGYPYGCVEQTMSRLWPSLIAQRALKKIGVPYPSLETRLPGMLQAGLQRLYGFQHEDGGWGWWKHDKTHPFMTGYVVMGLSAAKSAGVPMDERVLARGVEKLKEMVGAAPNAYLLWALSHEADLPADAVEKLLKEKLGPRDRIHLALAFLQRGQPQPAREWLEGAEAGDAETLALRLSARVRLDPRHPEAAAIVLKLLAMRRGNAWVSTRDSAFAVAALTDYVAATGDLNAGVGVTVRIDGQERLNAEFTRDTAAGFSGTLRVRDLKASNAVRIEPRGGPVFYALTLRYHEKDEPLRPAPGALVVSRRFDRVAGVNKGGDPILEPLETGARVRPGQLLQVTVTLRSEPGCANVWLDAPLPAGCEAVEEGEDDWQDYWFCRREYRDDRVSIAANEVGREPLTFIYHVRAVVPGRYHTLPAHAADMYAPETSGASGEFELRIAE